VFSGIQLFHVINDCFPASSLYSSGMPRFFVDKFVNTQLRHQGVPFNAVDVTPMR